MPKRLALSCLLLVLVGCVRVSEQKYLRPLRPGDQGKVLQINPGKGQAKWRATVLVRGRKIIISAGDFCTGTRLEEVRVGDWLGFEEDGIEDLNQLPERETTPPTRDPSLAREA